MAEVKLKLKILCCPGTDSHLQYDPVFQYRAVTDETINPCEKAKMQHHGRDAAA